MQKKKEIKLVSKDDPQSLKNEGSFKIGLLFLNLEFSWGFVEELLFVKATFDVNELFFWENRYFEDHRRDQCELIHLLLWEKKHSVSKSTTNWKWLLLLLFFLLPCLTRKNVLTPKITVIQLVPVQWGETYVLRKPHKDYSAVAHEIISVPKPVSLLYKDQVLWYHGKHE